MWKIYNNMTHYQLLEVWENKAKCQGSILFFSFFFCFHFINGMSKESNTAFSDISLCASLGLETFFIKQIDVSFYIQRRKVLNRIHRFDIPKSSRILFYDLESKAFLRILPYIALYVKKKGCNFSFANFCKFSPNISKTLLFSPQSHTGLFSLCPCNLPSHHLCFTFLPLPLFSYYSSGPESPIYFPKLLFFFLLIALLYQVFIIGCAFCSFSCFSTHLRQILTQATLYELTHIIS